MLRLSCGVVELFNDVRMGSENQTHQTIVLLWILAHSSMVLLSMVCYCVLENSHSKHGVLGTHVVKCGGLLCVGNSRC